MRKVNPILRRQAHISDRHIIPFDLAKGTSELKFGHVLSARQFGPPRFSNNLARVNRGAARRTTERRRIGPQAAPRTTMSLLIAHRRVNQSV